MPSPSLQALSWLYPRRSPESKKMPRIFIIGFNRIRNSLLTLCSSINQDFARWAQLPNSQTRETTGGQFLSTPMICCSHLWEMTLISYIKASSRLRMIIVLFAKTNDLYSSACEPRGTSIRFWSYKIPGILERSQQFHTSILTGYHVQIPVCFLHCGCVEIVRPAEWCRRYLLLGGSIAGFVPMDH